MTDRPIIFSGPMVRALLEGRKFMTRRVLKPQPPDYRGASSPPPTLRPKKHDMAYFDAYSGGPFWCWWDEYDRQGPGWVKISYAPGDRLWVRETWAKVPSSAYRMSDGVVQTQNPTDADIAAIYAAGWDRSIPGWRPSIFMPRWASRLTLTVTDVRVQRVQEISEEDARAEGVRGNAGGSWGCEGLIEDFADLWDSINAKRGYGWDANPWVVALTFTVHHQNIDRMGAI